MRHISSKWLRFLTATLATLLVALAGCSTQPPNAKQSMFNRQPSLVAEVDGSGEKTIYAAKAGRVDRQKAFRTRAVDWRTENPPAAVSQVVCYTVRETAADGKTKCAIKCTDGTWYSVSCDSDIIGSGVDIEAK